MRQPDLLSDADLALAEHYGARPQRIDDHLVLQIEKGVLTKDSLQLNNQPKMLIHEGNWAFYEPLHGLKLLHARKGLCHCIHRSARRFIDPSMLRDMRGIALDTLRIKRKRYWYRQWRDALEKPVLRRVAETAIAAQRLSKAGLGPPLKGLAIVTQFDSYYDTHIDCTAGLIVENAELLPTRPEVTDAEILECGVSLDQLRSCVRQQINGYVTDLNSVVGVMPIDAERETQTLTDTLSQLTNAQESPIERQMDAGAI